MATIAEKLTAVVSADISQYTSAVGKQVPAIARTAAAEIKRLGRAGQAGLNLVGKAARSTAAVLGRVAGAVKSTLSTALRYTKRLAQIGLVSLTAATTAAVGAATNFESAMAEVHSITSLSEGDLKALSNEVLDLTKAYGQSPVQQAKALYQVISAGVTDSAEAMQLLNVANKAAVAGMTDTFTAVDVLTTVMNSYGMATSEAMKVSDMLFTAVRLGKTTFPELAESMGTVASIAALANVPLEEVSAAVGTLTKGGIKTSKAMMYLRQVLMSIVKPSKQALDTAKELGIEFSATALASKGLVRFLEEVKEKTQGSADAIGKLFEDARTFTAVARLAGEQSAEFGRQLEANRNAAGATQVAFEKIITTVKFLASKTFASLKVLLVEIGNILLPFVAKRVKSMGKAFTTAAGWVREHADEISAALGKAYKWIGETLKGLKNTMSEILESMKNENETTWEMIKRKATGAWKAIKSAWEGAKTLLQPAIDALRKAAAGDWAGAWEDIKSGMRTALNAALDLAQEYAPKFVDFGVGLLQDLVDVLTGKDARGRSIIDQVAGLVSAIGAKLISLAPEIAALVAKLAWEITKNLPGAIGNILQTGVETVVNPLGIKTYRQEMAEGALGTFEEDLELTPEEWGAWQTQQAAEEEYNWDPLQGAAPAGTKGGPEGGTTKGGQTINVTQNFNYKTGTSEVERLAAETKRLQRWGRAPGFAQ